jgi:hypothetical protein
MCFFLCSISASCDDGTNMLRSSKTVLSESLLRYGSCLGCNKTWNKLMKRAATLRLEPPSPYCINCSPQTMKLATFKGRQIENYINAEYSRKKERKSMRVCLRIGLH